MNGNNSAATANCVAPTMPFMNVTFLHGIGYIIPIVIRLKSTGLNVLRNINLTCKDRFIHTYALERPVGWQPLAAQSRGFVIMYSWIYMCHPESLLQIDSMRKRCLIA